MTEATQSLYERLGGKEGIAAVVSDAVDLHMQHPTIKTRFSKADPKELKRLATEFFCMGAGGPEKYTGKDMREAHAAMNINDAEFNAVIDDLRGETDPGAREAGYQEAQQIIGEDLSSIFLFQLPQLGVRDARLQGVWANRPIQANDITGAHWAE